MPDPLNSTVALLDSIQAKTDTFVYWPYGEIRSRTGSTPTRFQFVGGSVYSRDASGRLYVRARHLDAAAGRWQSLDPLGMGAQDKNLYRYASDSPATQVDPMGTQPRRRPAPPRRPPPPPGIGAGQCPGERAYELLRERLRTRPKCAQIFRSVCKTGGGLAGEVAAGVVFDVADNCWKGRDPWSCMIGVKVELPSGAATCDPVLICFSTRSCFRPTAEKACYLLLEMMNWCGCKWLHEPFERTERVDEAVKLCGFKECHGAGTVIIRD